MSNDEPQALPGVEVVASSYGMILRFPDADAIQQQIEHLQGMLEAVERGLLDEPPYLYAVISAEIPDERREQIELYMNLLKREWQQPKEDEDATSE